MIIMQSHKLQSAFFIGLVLLTTAVFLWVIRAFLEPLFWAAVLGGFFYPVQRRFVGLLKGHRSLASLFTILVILVIVVLPLFFIVLTMTQESVSLYQRRSEARGSV